MKKANKFIILLVVCMMIFLCSCSKDDKKETEREHIQTNESSASEDMVPTEDEITLVEESTKDTLTEITELISGVIGTDLANAEEKIGEYFGVVIMDTKGNFALSDRKGLISRVYTYPQLLAKDDIRFNGMEIYADQSDGHVRVVKLTCANTTSITEPIEDTPEFRDEIRKLNINLNIALKKMMGTPYESGKLVNDENSIYYYYKASDDFWACVELRDFTDPGENGLLDTTVIYVEDELFLLY